MTPFPFKFDQLALVAGSMAQQRALTRAGAWTPDNVTTIGRNAVGKTIENKALLLFNYDLWPCEYEVLFYMSGDNWHEQRPDLPYPRLSHYGVHVKDAGEIDAAQKRWPVLQYSLTTAHSNPVIADSRRYKYVIFDTRAELGADLKLIQRLTLEESAALVAELRVDGVIAELNG